MLPDELVVMDDSRGMLQLLRALGSDSPVVRAAQALLAASERLLICTGFPVAGSSETDGPAGAIVLARSLCALSKRVALVSKPEWLRAWAPAIAGIECCGIERGLSQARLEGVPITIEICGRTRDGSYLNMHGEDVATDAPPFEDVVGHHALVSIGDGGNEFGMGSAPEHWRSQRAANWPISTCEILVVGQVSNWAALAIVAVLERITGAPLLPTAHTYQALLEVLAANGVVDGVSRLAQPTEDGRAIGDGGLVLDALARWANRRMLSHITEC